LEEFTAKAQKVAKGAQSQDDEIRKDWVYESKRGGGEVVERDAEGDANE
jgi:hypothetical protein